MSYIPAEREQPSAANAPSIFNTAYLAIRGGEAPQQRKMAVTPKPLVIWRGFGSRCLALR